MKKLKICVHDLVALHGAITLDPNPFIWTV